MSNKREDKETTLWIEPVDPNGKMKIQRRVIGVMVYDLTGKPPFEIRKEHFSFFAGFRKTQKPKNSLGISNTPEKKEKKEGGK